MPGPGSLHREGNPGPEAVVTWPRARGQDGVISSPWCYGEGNGWGQVWWTTQLADGDFEVWAELCGSIGSRPRYFILFLHIIKSLLLLCGFIVIVESGIDQWHIDSCPIHRSVIGMHEILNRSEWGDWGSRDTGTASPDAGNYPDRWEEWYPLPCQRWVHYALHIPTGGVWKRFLAVHRANYSINS